MSAYQETDSLAALAAIYASRRPGYFIRKYQYGDNGNHARPQISSVDTDTDHEEEHRQQETVQNPGELLSQASTFFHDVLSPRTAVEKLAFALQDHLNDPDYLERALPPRAGLIRHGASRGDAVHGYTRRHHERWEGGERMMNVGFSDAGVEALTLHVTLHDTQNMRRCSNPAANSRIPLDVGGLNARLTRDGDFHVTWWMAMEEANNRGILPFLVANDNIALLEAMHDPHARITEEMRYTGGDKNLLRRLTFGSSQPEGGGYKPRIVQLYAQRPHEQGQPEYERDRIVTVRPVFEMAKTVPA